jgi:hypothetical protein
MSDTKAREDRVLAAELHGFTTEKLKDYPEVVEWVETGSVGLFDLMPRTAEAVAIGRKKGLQEAIELAERVEAWILLGIGAGDDADAIFGTRKVCEALLRGPSKDMLAWEAKHAGNK